MGGVLGALVALVGNLIANWFQVWAGRVRQREQFDHDARERRTEREMALRRQIYLEAAEAIAKYQENLVNFANPNITDEQRTAMLEGARAAMNRVQIIGTLHTLEALSKAQYFFSRSSIVLLERQTALKIMSFRKADLESSGAALLSQLQGFATMESEAKTTRDALPPDFTEQVTQVITACQEKQGQLEQSRRAYEDAQINFMMEALNAAQQYADLVADALLKVRLELGIETDEAAYHKMFKGQDEEITRNLREMIDRSRSLMEQN